jgi:hypothetical protein
VRRAAERPDRQNRVRREIRGRRPPALPGGQAAAVLCQVGIVSGRDGNRYRYFTTVAEALGFARGGCTNPHCRGVHVVAMRVDGAIRAMVIDVHRRRRSRGAEFGRCYGRPPSPPPEYWPVLPDDAALADPTLGGHGQLAASTAPGRR